MKRLESEYRPAFWRQLGSLLDGGLPLSDALLALGRDAESKRISTLTERLRAAVEEGEAFSQAVDSSGLFDAATVACLQGGEACGDIAPACRLLAGHEEKSRSIRLRARMMLAYPVVLWAATLVGSLWIYRHAVAMNRFFDYGLIDSVPWLYRVLGTLHLLLLLSAVAGLAASYGWRNPEGVPGLRRRLESFVLRIPVWSHYWRAIVVARFTRGLSVLLGAGLPLDRALTIASSASGSLLLQEQVADAARAVRDGERVAGRLANGPILPQAAVWSIRTAEERGDLAETTDELASCYEEIALVGGSTALTVLEPAAIAVMGVIAALTIVAAALPQLSMYSWIQ